MTFVVTRTAFSTAGIQLSLWSVPSPAAKAIRRPNRTLVILNGSPRCGDTAWESLYTQLLDVNNADLALAFGASPDWNSTLYSRAKYIWEFPELDDWGEALDQMGTGWRRYKDRDNVMGGVRGSNGQITRGSGAILFWIRWFVKGKLVSEPGLLDQYDWFVYTRSDHFYYCPHDLKAFQKDPNSIYIPQGESYQGYTDRHLVASRELIIPALSIFDDIARTDNPDEMNESSMETLIARRWRDMNLNVVLFERMFFTCAKPGDTTRWKKSDIHSTPDHIKELGIALKYPKEYFASEKYCKWHKLDTANELRKNCQIIYITGVEERTRQAIGPVIESLALNQIDPETGLKYYVDVVEQLSYNPLDWIHGGARREWGFDNMTNIHDPISVVKESCPNDGLRHVYIKWTSFPQVHDGLIQAYRNLRAPFLKLTNTREIENTNTALHYTTDMSQFIKAYSPYVDIKFIVLHRPLLEIVASFGDWDGGPTMYKLADDEKIRVETPPNRMKMIEYSDIVGGFILMLRNFLDQSVNTAIGRSSWSLVCIQRLLAKNYYYSKDLLKARRNVMMQLTTFLGWPLSDCPHCFDGWTKSSNDPLEGLEEEDVAMLVENMKYLDMSWPPPGEEGIDEQQCGQFYEKCSYVDSNGVEVIAQPNMEEPATSVEQVASQALLNELHLDIATKRPIWTSMVVGELDNIVSMGGTISCPHFPHSAEDIALALNTINLDLSNLTVGVVSSISPWVEHILRSAGASNVVTIDYNEPIVCSGVSWIESKSVSTFASEVGVYNLLVSFSGIEHTGLGRYGDPINPNGDIDAMDQIHMALAPGGYLLLAIPTMEQTFVAGDWNRVYGPDRLAQMFGTKFNFVGRVWDGKVFGGWSEIESIPRLFPNQSELNGISDWQFENVLILQKIDEKCSYVDSNGVEVIAQPNMEEPATYVEQVASRALLNQLHLDIATKRPIWTSMVVEELDNIVSTGGTISCPAYPHSAEDVALALNTINLDLPNLKVGVVSSISPWVEHILRSAGASHVVTIDYNEPIVCSGVSWIESKSVSTFATEVGVYNLLVSFSGVQHFGLGRYGDPINPNGDIEAMDQMHMALAPGGHLLLAIPTTEQTFVKGKLHRVYGPDRLAQMFGTKFNFVGRVWDGKVFGGWSEVESIPRLFPNYSELNGILHWQFENVLILQKM
jgi:uncharacterized protein YsxB (DUF464 family)/tetrahydromethanopterin S-methyltransferase subunit F